MTRVEQIGDCTLHLGDCREILPTLQPPQAGMVVAPKGWAIVTDPPYGIANVWKGGFGSGWGRARAASAERNKWDAEAPHDVIDMLACFEESIIWGGNYFNLPPSRCWLVWNKPERGFSLAEAELAWTNFDAVVRVCDAARSDVGREHPTQKSLKVMQWSIQKTKAHTILDPFMGSGTTGVACVKLGRKFIGIEISEEYFDIACRRIEKAYAQPDLFVDQPKPEAPKQFELLGDAQ